MIATKTVPIGMNVNFRIPFFSVCVCVIFYCLPAIKPNTMTKYKRMANDTYPC